MTVRTALRKAKIRIAGYVTAPDGRKFAVNEGIFPKEFFAPPAKQPQTAGAPPVAAAEKPKAPRKKKPAAAAAIPVLPVGKSLAGMRRAIVPTNRRHA